MNNIQKLLPLTSNKNIPGLENFLIKSDDNGNVTASATDLQTYAVVPSSLKLPPNLSFTIQASKFVDLMRAIGTDAELSLTDSHLVIKSGKSKYTLPILPTDEFPAQPKLLPAQFGIDCISDIISNTIWATSKDELRQSMTGVLFDNGKAVATDAHKLVVCDYTASGGDEPIAPIIVPSKSLSVIDSLFGATPVEVSSDGSRAVFSGSGISVFVRLIDERYPDYNAVIPRDGFTGSVRVNAKNFQDAITRLRIASNDATNLIAMSVSVDSIELSASNVDYSLSGLEHIDAAVNGEPIEIGFNGNFMLSALKRVSSSDVEISYISPSRAMILRDLDKIILIMPVRID